MNHPTICEYVTQEVHRTDSSSHPARAKPNERVGDVGKVHRKKFLASSNLPRVLKAAFLSAG